MYAIRIRAEISRLAPLDRPVAITGPRGAGRLLCGVLVYQGSSRVGRPLLQTSLIMPDGHQRQQLFGIRHGTVDIPGLLKQSASGRGTVILQDPDWLSWPVQQEVVRACLGPNPRFDVRLILIMSESIETLVQRRRLCPELASAVAGAEIKIPSLVKRPEDVAPIAERMWQEISFGRSLLPQEVKDDTRRQVFTHEADELYTALVTLWDMCAGGTPTVLQFRAALAKSRRTHPAHSTPSGQRFGVEVDPTDLWLGHLKRVSIGFRELWVSFRPIRDGLGASVTMVLDGLARMDAALATLDKLFDDPFNFSRNDIYHDTLDFKGEMYKVRQLASVNPHVIGEIWAKEYDQRLDREHRRIEDLLFDERKRLGDSGPFRQ